MKSLVAPTTPTVTSSLTAVKLFEHIKIQTNSVCTRRCHFCLYGQKTAKIVKGQVLSEQVVYRMLDELASINFSGRLTFFNFNF